SPVVLPPLTVPGLAGLGAGLTALARLLTRLLALAGVLAAVSAEANVVAVSVPAVTTAPLPLVLVVVGAATCCGDLGCSDAMPASICPIRAVIAATLTAQPPRDAPTRPVSRT